MKVTMDVTCLWITKHTSTTGHIYHLMQKMHVRISISSYLWSVNLYNAGLIIYLFCLHNTKLIIVLWATPAHHLSIGQREQCVFIRLCVAHLWVFCFEALSFLCQFRHAGCNSPALFLRISNKSETQNVVLIYVAGQLSGSLACVMRWVKSLKCLNFSLMKVELKIGVVIQTGKCSCQHQAFGCNTCS